MKKLMIGAVVAAVAVLTVYAASTKCRYCGSSSFGSGCSYSPTGKHQHGSGAEKCTWCGSSSTGSGCSYSPTGRHER